MRLEEVVVCASSALAVLCVAGRVDAEDISALTEALGLVDGARVSDQVAKGRRGAIAVAREQLGEAVMREPAELVQPHGQGEVVKGHHGDDPLLAARGQHPTVMVEGGQRELALRGLDPRPLDAESKRRQPDIGHQRYVLSITVVEVACIPRRLDAR